MLGLIELKLRPAHVINGLESVVGNHLTIWGGDAGADRIYDHTMVFTNQQSSDTGILLLVVNAAKIMIKGNAGYGGTHAGT